MKPKILIVQPEIYMWGGAERQIAHMCNYFTEHNYPTTVLTCRAIPEFKAALKEARIIEVGQDIQKLYSTFQTIMHKFDIINPHNHPTELMIAPRRIPTVWQLNEPPIEVLKGGSLPEGQKDTVKKYIHKIVVITDYEKERSGKIYERDDLIVNYPGVRYDYFAEKVDPEATRKKYHLEGKFVILEAGYITFTKNQMAAVEILAKVKKDIPNAVLVLSGYDKDPYKMHVESKALELGVGDDVIFTGFVEKDEEMRDLYNIADVYIGPFLDQGGWATTFEASCAGCPIVMSPKFVAANLVKSHNLGHVCEIENFPQAILNIKDFPDVAKQRTKKTAKWIGTNLTWDAFCQKYLDIFEEIWHDNDYAE
jgi:glycosyltransferase involved in cell wall biosynthesis